MIKKIGSPEQITRVVTSAFAFDPGVIAQKLSEGLKGAKAVSLNQVHEFVKSLGVIDYSKEDMDTLVNMLTSTGITVNP